MKEIKTVTDEDIVSLEEAIRKKSNGSETRRERIIIGSILTIAIGKPEMLG